MTELLEDVRRRVLGIRRADWVHESSPVDKANARLQHSIKQIEKNAAQGKVPPLRVHKIVSMAQGRASRAYAKGERFHAGNSTTYPAKHYRDIEKVLGVMSAPELKLFDDAYNAYMAWEGEVQVHESSPVDRAPLSEARKTQYIGKYTATDAMGRVIPSKKFVAVKIPGVNPLFHKEPFGRQLDDHAKIKNWKESARHTYLGTKGKAALAAVKEWIKDVKPREFYAVWENGDHSVTLYFKHPTNLKESMPGKSLAGTIERFRSTVYSRMKKAEHYANKEDLDKAWKELDAAMISIQSLTKAINIARHEDVVKESHEGNALSSDMYRLMDTVMFRFQRAEQLAAQGLEDDAWSELDHAKAAFQAMMGESVDYSSDDSEELPEKVIDRLEAEGIKVRHWERGGHVRYYLKQGSRDLGYLVPGDDGSSGTCKGITKRQGYIAGLVRSALRESTEFSEMKGEILKSGTSTFQVIRKYDSKMDATGPIGRDFLRTIPSGGGGALVKKVSGGHQAGYYFIALDSRGKPDGKPMWMSPANYKRAMRYE